MVKQPEYRERVDAWVDSHTEQMLEDVKTLVRIPSVRGEAKAGMPFGEMPAKALGAMRDLMEKYGLRTTDYDNYCVAGDLDAEGERHLDILAHLDVVPVTENWKTTSPFEPYVEGSRIYGRGTSDDKGPAIAALYAMRCIQELGLKLKHGVRLICGSDEECGSGDLAYYYGREKEALHTFSPDADYPLINIEKGRLQKAFFAKGSSACSQSAGMQGGTVRVKSIRAGSAVNIVPGQGTLVVTGATQEMLQLAAQKTQEAAEKVLKDQQEAAEEALKDEQKAAGVMFSWESRDEEFVITASGKSSHAAHPMGGINSVTLILEFLKHLDLADAPGENMLLAAGRLWPHGDFHGEHLGVDYSDEESGRLTMSLDTLEYDDVRVKSPEAEASLPAGGDPPDTKGFRLEGTFDCRAPLCCTDENLTRKIREKLQDAGFEMEEGTMVPGHYVSPESELVQKLLESYELYFEKKGVPVAIGGGTYVHELERGVAFGCADPKVDNRMHGDDEFMEIPMLVRSTKIFADAIMRLCG